MKKTYGFTLIELTIVLVITSIIVVVGSVLLSNGFNSYFTNRDITAVNREANTAFERIGREVRAANIFTTMLAQTLQLTDIDGNVVRYTLTGNTITRQQNGGAARVIIDNVTALSFNYFDNNLAVTAVAANVAFVSATMTLARGDGTLSFRTTTYARNTP